MTVGIVGAGVTGLALASHLTRRGVPCRVLEARDRPGGVLASAEVDGRVLDFGPQRTRLTPGVSDLVEAAGIESRVRQAADRPIYVYRDGALREVPLDLRTAVRTDLLSWRGKLRALAEPLTGPPRADETVGGFLRRAFGREVADYLAGPLYAGLYGSHPDEMPVRHSLGKALAAHGNPRSLLLAALRARFRGRDPPPIVSFEGGMAELPRALADRYGDRVELGTPVRRVEAVDGDARYRLETPDGGLDVDQVVLTTPAGAAASLLGDVAPDAADALSALTYSPLGVVHLVATGGGLDAAGYQVQFDEDLATLGITSNHGLFGRFGLHTCYLGGRRNPDLPDVGGDHLGRVAAEEFEDVTGLAAEPIHVRRLRPGMPACDRSWTALEGLSLPDGVHLCANYESRAGIPGRARAARRLAESLAGACDEGRAARDAADAEPVRA